MKITGDTVVLYGKIREKCVVCVIEETETGCAVALAESELVALCEVYYSTFWMYNVCVFLKGKREHMVFYEDNAPEINMMEEFE